MNKCSGCGVLLQNNDLTKEGYINDINNDLCERCFRIRNYGEYKIIKKENEEFTKILKQINGRDLVILLVDLLNISQNIEEIKKHLINPLLLVVTKRDLFPKSISNTKILSYFSDLKLNIVDKIVISSNNNFQLDLLMSKIKKHQTSKNVYVVGTTNAGKSTLINKIIKNYSSSINYITTSSLPSTTLDIIKKSINENLVLIDTPGLLEESLTNYVEPELLKKMTPKYMIKPLVYQARSPQTILIENILKIEISNGNLIFFISNNLEIKRYYKTIKSDNLVETRITANDYEDIVIPGLGFIKITQKCLMSVYTIPNIKIYTRKSII